MSIAEAKKKLADVDTVLADWLTDNTEDVFEEQPEIDNARVTVQEAMHDLEAAIPTEHIKAISDLIDYCYDNVPYFGEAGSTPDFHDPSYPVDTADLGKRACDALKFLQSITKDGEVDDAACAHEWVHTGTAYGGDDDSHHGEGRVYCSKCGEDGDA